MIVSLPAEELARQRDALVDEIQMVKCQHHVETEKLKSDHQAALENLEIRMKKEEQDEIKRSRLIVAE